MSRALGQLDQLSPPRRGCVVSSLTPGDQRERPKSVDRQRHALSAPCRKPEIVRTVPGCFDFSQHEGALERLLRPFVETGVAIDATERKRLACVGRRVGPSLHQRKNPRGESGQRKQIQPVVMEHLDERCRIACSDEPKVPRGNFEPGHVARSLDRRAAVVRAHPANIRLRLHLPRTGAPDGQDRRADDSRTVIRDDGTDSASRASAHRTTCR